MVCHDPDQSELRTPTQDEIRIDLDFDHDDWSYPEGVRYPTEEEIEAKVRSRVEKDLNSQDWTEVEDLLDHVIERCDNRLPGRVEIHLFGCSSPFLGKKYLLGVELVNRCMTDLINDIVTMPSPDPKDQVDLAQALSELGLEDRPIQTILLGYEC